MAKLEIKYRLEGKALPPRPVRLSLPGWGGAPEMKKEDGSQPQPWHCPLHVEGATHGIELLYQYDQEARERLAALTRMIVESPSLIAREQQIFQGYTASLAGLISEETGAEPDAVEPWVAANAMMGVHRRLIDFTRGRIIAGARHPELAADVLAEADRGLALLADGLGGYAVKEP